MLKHLFIFILLLLLTVKSFGQKSVNQFINELKKNKTCLAVTLPGWMINSGTRIALKQMNEQDKSEIVALGKKIKQLRFIIIEDDLIVSKNEFLEAIRNMQDKDKFEIYANGRTKDGTLYVMVKEKKETIKFLTMLYYDHDMIAVVNIKSDLKISDLEAANFSFNNPDFSF